MGFLSGRASFLRFKVAGRAPRHFSDEHLQKLTDRAIGKQRVRTADGVEVGWTAGDHILDTRFDLEKNILEDTLHFSIRVDEVKIPSDLLRAYTAVELEGLAAGNPSGFASSKQKKEARANARERLEQEAADGRYLRRKAYPLLWDCLSNELLVGTTSAGVLDRLHTHFKETFGHGFELQSAGPRAFQLAELREQTRSVDDARPSGFVGGSGNEVAWVLDEGNRDFLGNEFLLWLWYYLDAESDSLDLADKSEVAMMLARTLHLECPRGVTGKEVISSDSPPRLPEARRAIQTGKLPRKAGLMLSRHDRQYEFTLQAETLGIQGLALPASEEEEERSRHGERIQFLRHFLETLDLVYDAFGRIRSSESWTKELAKIRKWLQREDRDRISATG